MESKVFFEKNVVRVNKLISHLMVLSLIVVPILAVLRFFGIYSVSYKYIIVLFLMDLGITSCQVIMVHTKVNPAFVKHYTLWSLCVFVCAMGSSRHLGIYVLFSIVPFLSCLYMDVKLTITANIINCFSTFTALYFRALEAVREEVFAFPTVSSFLLPYGAGALIEALVVLMISYSISNLIRTTIIRNKLSERKIYDMQQSYIYFSANLVESHEKFTGLHLKRTAIFVEYLAHELLEEGMYSDVLTPEYIELLKKAAYLHDIGKISVLDSVLTKPGKYTDEEFDQMKIHCKEGWRLIEENLRGVESDDFLNIAGDVALCHHERWDGSGYPNKLKGEQIPLSARIMAVADVTDALLSKRLYKEALGLEETMRIMEAGKGTQFEPCIVDALLSIQGMVSEVAIKYSDEENLQHTITQPHIEEE